MIRESRANDCFYFNKRMQKALPGSSGWLCTPAWPTAPEINDTTWITQQCNEYFDTVTCHGIARVLTPRYFRMHNSNIIPNFELSFHLILELSSTELL